MPEPTNPSISMTDLWRWSRPGTLPITATACVLGFASAFGCGHELGVVKVLAALLLALLCHAAANVLQGAEDTAVPGQAQWQQARQLAWAVLAWVAAAAVLLALNTGGGLLLLGLVGMVLIWVYSAAAWRGLAQRLRPWVAVLVWWLVVLGADYMGRQHFFLIPALTAASFALLVGCAALLSPATPSPQAACAGGAAVLPPSGTRLFALLYTLLALAAYAWLALGVVMLYQPTQSVWGLVSLPFSAWAVYVLWHQPGQRQLAWRLSLLAAHLHGLAMAGGLVLTLLW